MLSKMKLLAGGVGVLILFAAAGCQHEDTKKSKMTVETKNSKTEVEVKKTQKHPD